MIPKMVKQFLAFLLVLAAATAVLAQQGAVKGVVKGKQNDADTSKIVEGAIVDIFRIDITQKFQTKTDKKGEYYHSLPAFGEYVVSVSGAGYTPVTSNKFKLTADAPLEQNFELVSGDGTRLTQEQVVNIVKNGASAPNTAAAAPKIDKEKQEQLLKERKELEAKNDKIRKDFDEMKKHVESGAVLAQKNDYEGAIKEFQQAMALDDAQPTVYAQLAQALFNLGAVRFNAKQRDEAQKCFQQSAQYGEKAVKLEATNAANYKIYGDSCEILFKQFGAADFADKAITAYTSGADIETDPAKKYKMLNKIGGIYFNKGEMDKCAASYDKVLAADPNNTEALTGKGTIIVATTTSNTTPQDKAKLEEAMNIFQQVVDKLPEGKQRAEVEGYISYLKDTMKIEPPSKGKGGGDKGKDKDKDKGKKKN